MATAWLLVTAGCDKSPAHESPGKPDDAGAPTAVTDKEVRPGADGTVTPTDPARTAEPPALTGPPKWACEKSVYDFGEAWAGEDQKYEFKFRNAGGEVLRILETKAKCGCTVTDNYTREVPPGGEGVIPVTLNTTGLSGFVSKTLDIHTNDPVNGVATLEMKGNPKPVFIMDPSNGASFGRVKTHQPLQQVVTLRNNTGQPVNMEPPVPVGPSIYKTDFKVVEPGQVYQVIVSADPPIPVGTWSSTILNCKIDFPNVKLFAVHVAAFVPERFSIVPTKMVVDAATPTDSVRPVRVENNDAYPAEILSIRTSEPRFRPTLLPTMPNAPNFRTINVTIPGGYRPPAWGEIIEVRTTDPEKDLVTIVVQPTFGDVVPRPADAPLNLVDVPLPQGDTRIAPSPDPG